MPGFIARDHQHNAGDIINFDETPPGPIGVSQSVRLLGPYSVTYDLPGISVNGVAVETLDEGTIVIRAWAVVSETFNGNSVGMWIAVGDAETGDWATSVRIQRSNGAAPYPTDSATAAGAVSERGPRFDDNTITVTAQTSLVVALGTENADPSTATEGAAEVYALIAVPA